MKWCPTCGTFHQPGAHGPATPPQRPPEQPPENPAPPPPDDSQADGGGAAESAAAGGGDATTDGDGDDDKDSGEAPATGEPQQQPAANGRPRVRGNGGAAQAGQGRATLRTGPPAAADGAENAASSPYSTGTYVPPPPPVDDPGIWHQYLQQLPPQDKARRQAAHAQVQSQLADLNRRQRIEQGGVYVETAEELKFLEYTGYLPTLDDETDEATLTAERIRREKAAAAKERKKAREEGRLRRSDKERNRVIGAPNATVERDEYGTVTIDGRQVVGTSSSGGVITYQFEDGGIERFVLETGEDGAPQPDFSKGQVIRGVEGQKSLAEQYRAVSLDTDEARAWQQSEMNRIAKLPEPMQEEFRWYVDQVMSASNQNQLDLAQKGLADRWEEYGDSQTQAWRTEQMEHISANVSQGEQAEFQRLVDNVVNARTRDELESANKALSGHWEAWVAAENARRAAAARAQAQQSRKVDTPQPTLERDDDGTWMVDGRRVKQTISSSDGTVTYFFEDGGMERFVYGTGADGRTQVDFSRGQVVKGVEGQKSLVEQYAPISLETEGATAWQTAQQERIADTVPQEQQAEFRQLVDNVLNAENQQQLDAATIALAERWEKWDASVALTNTTTIQGHTEELATLSYADSPQFNDLMAKMRDSGLYTEESLDAMAEEWLTNAGTIQGHNAELAALTESGPGRLADSPEFVDLMARMRDSGLYTEESLDALEAEAAIPRPPSLLRDDVEYTLVTESGSAGVDTGVGYTMSEGPSFGPQPPSLLEPGAEYTLTMADGGATGPDTGEGYTMTAWNSPQAESIRQQVLALDSGDMTLNDIPPADRARFEGYLDWYRYTGELPTFREDLDTLALERADAHLEAEQADALARYNQAWGDTLYDDNSANATDWAVFSSRFRAVTGRNPTGDPEVDARIWRDAQTGQAAGDYLQSGLVYNQGLNAGSLDDFGERGPSPMRADPVSIGDFAEPQRAPIVSGPDVAPPRLSYTEGLAGAQAVSQETGSVRFNTLDEWREQSGGTVYINNRAFEIDDLVTARYDSAGLKHRNPSNRGELRKEAEAKALAFLNSQPEGSITLQPRSYSPLTSLDELGETFYVDGVPRDKETWLDAERKSFESKMASGQVPGGLAYAGWDETAHEAAALATINQARAEGRLTTESEGPGAPHVQVGQNLTDTPLWLLPIGGYLAQGLTTGSPNSPGGSFPDTGELRQEQFEGMFVGVDVAPFPGPGTAARGIRRAATGLVDAGGNLIQSARLADARNTRITVLHDLSRSTGAVDDAMRFDSLVRDYQGQGYSKYNAYEAAAQNMGLVRGGDPKAYDPLHTFSRSSSKTGSSTFTVPDFLHSPGGIPARPPNLPQQPMVSSYDKLDIGTGKTSSVVEPTAPSREVFRIPRTPVWQRGHITVLPQDDLIPATALATRGYGDPNVVYRYPPKAGRSHTVTADPATTFRSPFEIPVLTDEDIARSALAHQRSPGPPSDDAIRAQGRYGPVKFIDETSPPLNVTARSFAPESPAQRAARLVREANMDARRTGGQTTGSSLLERYNQRTLSPGRHQHDQVGGRPGGNPDVGAGRPGETTTPQGSPTLRASTGVAESPMVRTPAGLLVPASSPGLHPAMQPGLQPSERTSTYQEGRLEEEEELATRQALDLGTAQDLRRGLDAQTVQRQRLDVGTDQRQALDLRTDQQERLDLDTARREGFDLDTRRRERLDLDTPQRQRLDLDTPQRQRLDLDTPQRQRLDLDTPQRQRLDLDTPQRQRLDLDTPQRQRGSALTWTPHNGSALTWTPACGGDRA